jgi:hypothetical protein
MSPMLVPVALMTVGVPVNLSMGMSELGNAPQLVVIPYRTRVVGCTANAVAPAGLPRLITPTSVAAPLAGSIR